MFTKKNGKTYLLLRVKCDKSNAHVLNFDASDA